MNVRSLSFLSRETHNIIATLTNEFLVFGFAWNSYQTLGRGKQPKQSKGLNEWREESRNRGCMLRWLKYVGRAPEKELP